MVSNIKSETIISIRLRENYPSIYELHDNYWYEQKQRFTKQLEKYYKFLQKDEEDVISSNLQQGNE